MYVTCHATFYDRYRKRSILTSVISLSSVIFIALLRHSGVWSAGEPAHFQPMQASSRLTWLEQEYLLKVRVEQENLL
ncbi:hypothetical protein Y032_0585g328 [Ancylostoma ceylanicum]|uniref:Uncharacterized protein n=1 Tax=Ancylostoma ceylanicum TaxID=53326 RepID=A0A016WP78_9BILA|nr:hypothetical protein Y032_0585g328 [Ancylostoma ceylanicum]